MRYFQASFRDGKSVLVDDPVWAMDFAPNGTLLGLGDVMTRKRYAEYDALADRRAVLS